MTEICYHNGSILYDSYGWAYPVHQAICLVCNLKSRPQRYREEALLDLKTQSFKADLSRLGFKDPSRLIKDFHLSENPILEVHNTYTINSVLGAPYGGIKGVQTATGANAMLDQSQSITAKSLNQTYQKLQEKIAVAISSLPTQKPYWIIVSDEGHARIPHKHLTRTQADAEALRLSEANPGKTFTVFESKASLITPKTDTKKTEYAAPWSYHMSYVPFNSRVPF